MGYSTHFSGGFKLNKPLTIEDKKELEDFSKEQHVYDKSPSFWCQWVPHEDGEYIVWDGEEKFYAYEEWLVYIIDNLLTPKGYVLNGDVKWQGEDMDDRGILTVKDNVVSSRRLE